MATLVENVTTAIVLINQERDRIEGDVTDYIIPDGTTEINQYAFYGQQNMLTVYIPNSVSVIGMYAFANSALTGELKINGSVKQIASFAFAYCGLIGKFVCESGVEEIGYGAFNSCNSITEIVLPNTITTLSQCFGSCSALHTINFPASLIHISGPCAGCGNLENVTLGSGFNCNSLDLSSSTKYSVNTLVAMFNALADRTGFSAYTLYIGSDNITKLTPEQIAIATNKNWNLA